MPHVNAGLRPCLTSLSSRFSATWRTQGAVMGLVLFLSQLGAPPAVRCATIEAKAATVTSLAVTAAGKPVTSSTQVSSGTVITLTATVTAGGKAVNPGQVNFCDAKAKYCSDIHVLATVQLIKEGKAVYKFRPAIGSHKYKAEFLGTHALDNSSSGGSELTVTGTPVLVGSAAAISESGAWGQYLLTARVSEAGSTAPVSGQISFVDTSRNNAVLRSVTLGNSIAGTAWPGSLSLPVDHADSAVSIGDFNGDGIPDIAAAAGGPDTPVMIFLGNPDGSYKTAASTSFFDYIDSTPIVVADFNGDGNQDLAVLDTGTNKVVILLGNGDGTFNVAASSPAISSGALNLIAGDFDGDGIQDLVVIGNSPAFIEVLLGKGDGTFTAAPGHPSAANSPAAAAVGDFNHDGNLDLAIADAYDDTVTVLLGNGDGTFKEGAPIHCGSSGSAIVAADFTGSGNLDLAVGVQSSSGAVDALTILKGRGDGTFESPSSGSPVNSQNITSLLVGDFNADGIVDLVLGDSQAGTFRVLMGDGHGGFTAQTERIPGGTFGQLALAAGDLRGTGRTDIAAAFVESLLVYPTQPTQTATATAGISLPVAGEHLVDASYAGNARYKPSASGTVSLSGVPPATTTDLSLSANGAPATSVTPGTAITLKATVKRAGVLLTSGLVNFCDASAASCTDIHLLGTASITSSGSALLKFIPGPGTHNYKAEFVQEVSGKSSSSNVVTLDVGPTPPPRYSATTTLSSQGNPGGYSLTATVEGFGGVSSPTGNVAFVDTSFGNKVLATAPLGTATPGIGWLISQTPAISYPPTAEVAGDFNGDGIPDLAVLWAQNTYSSPYSVTIFFGKGDGTFTLGPTTQATGVQTQPAMIAGDFNGDDNLDLAILSLNNTNSENDVTVLLGKGNGGFSKPITTAAYQQPLTGGDVISGSLVAADFNGDGKLDVAVVGDSVDDGGVTILLGKGDGSFTVGSGIDTSQGFGLIATGDFNGDGIPDLVTATYFQPGVATVFLGKGDGSFTAGQSLDIQFFPDSIVVGDFTGKGKLDLAFGYEFGLGVGVAVYLGNGEGRFTEAPGSPYSGGSGGSLVAGDFNGDGKVDLAGVDDYNDQIDLYLGAGNGKFEEIVTTPNIGQTIGLRFRIVAADFTKDGIPDLALLTSNQDTASILLTEQTETATATVTGIAPIGAGMHNVEASYAGDSHYGRSVSATVQLTAGLAPPVISPTPGTYTSQQKVTITEAIPGATVYYSASGTVNTRGFIEYTGPFFLPYGGFEEIQAYATETGYQQSSYTTGIYNLDLPAAPKPVFSPPAASYSGTQTVSISDTAPNALIYYTTNGSYPSVESTAYSGPITVSTSELISAIAVAPGYSQSGIAGAQYLIDSSQSRLIYTIAGSQSAGYQGDGGAATFASFEDPYTVARDANGDLYIGDEYTVRKVAAGTGIITTVAGNGHRGYSGDGGSATTAELDYVEGVATDKAGNLYIADDTNCAVREVAAASGKITTMAGDGKCGYTADNVPATKAELAGVYSLAFDKSGNLYIGTSGRIRKVAAGTAVITTVAGNGIDGYSGDHGPATQAELSSPSAIAFDSAGDLYFADSSESVIRKVAAGTSIITTVAGKQRSYPPPPNNGDGGPATDAILDSPEGLAIDTAGNLYISDTFDGALREVTASNQIINTIAGGSSGCSLLGGDGGPALASDLCYPSGVTIDPSGNLYIAESSYSRVREITAPTAPPTHATPAPAFSLAAGTYSSIQTLTITAAPGAEVYLRLDGSTPATTGEGYYIPVTVAGPVTVSAIALAPGFLPSPEVTATYNVTAPAPATISTVAGSGIYGAATGPALEAEFGYMYGVAADGEGNLYVADPDNGVVWKLTAATRTVSVAAGTPGEHEYGYVGPEGPATKAILSQPSYVAVDAVGNLFISDWGYYRVFKVSASTGIISTYAGGGQSYTYPSLGDGGLATAAYLESPQGIAIDKSGNLYIADEGIGRIRRVDAATGIITSVAGETGATSLGDGGPATAAMLSQPQSVAFDGAGNFYIGDVGNARIRKVAATSGMITTVAGDGIYGSAGNGGLAVDASIGPWGIAVDASGAVYFGNVDNTIRKFVPGGDISAIAGTGYYGFAGDNGPARMAELCGGAGLAFDKAGNLYIADGCNYRVRKVSFSQSAAAQETSNATGKDVPGLSH